MTTLNERPFHVHWPCLILLYSIVTCLILPEFIYAGAPTHHDPANAIEEKLRSALTESLKEKAAEVCKEMRCIAPSIDITADLSETLRTLPENLATSPTVRCHDLPGFAVAADSWAHLAEAYAASERGVRRITLEMMLSRKENVLSIVGVSAKSVQDYGHPALQLSTNDRKKLLFVMCGVDVSLKTHKTYVVDVNGRRLGAIYEGDGELVLEPTCSRAWVMLSDFIDPSEGPISIERLFITLPRRASEREPKPLGRLRKQLDKLRPPNGDASGSYVIDEATGEFVNVCVNAASPHRGERSLEGLAPFDGYEHAVMVVQTEELGTYAFSFAGERGNETVIMTQPRTRSIVSFWEAARARHRWIIPRVEQYSFDIEWLPEAMRFDVRCEMGLTGIEAGRDIIFMLNPVCKVRRCLIDGRESRFAQHECSQDEKAAMALSSNFTIDWIEGWLRITPPGPLDRTGETELSVEYTIDYGSCSATDALGASHFYDDAVVLHGDAVRWFPYVGWRPRAPLRTRIRVPNGYMGVTIGKYGGKVTENESDIFTYDATFPMPTSAFVVGKFKEFTHETRRRDGLKRPAITMLSSGDECVARRYLDVVATMVDWALKYCGDFPYEELRFVTMPGNRSWATMLTFPNSCLEMDITNYGLMSHEISHQWWGNEAGTINLDDQWMVEGGATFFTFLCIEDLNIIGSYAFMLKNRATWIRRFDSPPPIATGFRLPSELRMLFYFKGAYVFEMLRMATNNDRHFFATLKQ
ncbi:MAG: hypothetical protein JW941_11410, partial [Candidatus Coatesbacteria bacterium]|nr:hypothetical protein [Candidatus Coatesbacteria bacterium]